MASSTLVNTEAILVAENHPYPASQSMAPVRALPVELADCLQIIK